MTVVSLLALIGGTEVVGLIGQTGWVVRGVLLLLLTFSVFSWTVTFAKWRRFRRARAQSERFLRAFRRSQTFSELHAISDQFHPSPLVEMFEYGYGTIRQQATPANPHSGRLPPGGVARVQRALQIAAGDQLTGMERMLSWLASTGVVAPFIGLFGTVWGVMDSFHGLGTADSASLRAVAPGISEALVATAAGLFVAIPAVVAYNHFLHVLRDFGSGMDSFALEFLNVVERDQAG